MKNQYFYISALVFIVCLCQITAAKALPYQVIDDRIQPPYTTGGNVGFDAFIFDDQIIQQAWGKLRIWDKSSERIQKEILLPPLAEVSQLSSEVTATLENPGGDCQWSLYQNQWVTACSHTPGIRLWDRHTGQQQAELKQTNLVWIEPERTACAPPFSPQLRLAGHVAVRQRLVSMLKVWDADQHLLYQHRQPSPILQMRASDAYIAIRLLNQEVRVYALSSGLLAFQTQVSSLISDMSINAGRLALASENGQIKIWDLKSKQLIFEHQVQTESFRESTIVMIGAGTVANTCPFTSQSYLHPNRQHAFSKLQLEGNYLLGQTDTDIRVLDIKTGQSQRFQPYYSENLTQIEDRLYGWNTRDHDRKNQRWAYDLQQRRLYLSHRTEQETPDHRLQDPISGEYITFPLDLLPIESTDPDLGLDFSPLSGRYSESLQQEGLTLTWGSDSELEIWDLETRRLIRNLPLAYPLLSLDLSDQGLVLAYRAPDQPGLEIVQAPDFLIRQRFDGPTGLQAAKIKAGQIWTLSESATLPPVNVWQWPVPNAGAIGPTELRSQTPDAIWLDWLSGKSTPLKENSKQVFAAQPVISGGERYLPAVTHKKTPWAWQFGSEGLEIITFQDDSLEVIDYPWNQSQGQMRYRFNTQYPQLIYLKPKQLVWKENYSDFFEVNLRNGQRRQLAKESLSHLLLVKTLGYGTASDSALQPEPDHTPCEGFQVPLNQTNTWQRWKDACYLTLSDHILIRDLKSEATRSIPLHYSNVYASDSNPSDSWVRIWSLDGNDGWVNLETQQQFWNHQGLELVDINDKTLTLAVILPDFYPGNASLMLSQAPSQLKNINSLREFKVLFHEQAAILIAPDGNYAGWGNYQKYLHFNDTNGQMIPWPEAERRWHQPQQVQAQIQTLLSEEDDAP